MAERFKKGWTRVAFGDKEARNVDQKRGDAGVRTRRSTKKPAAVTLTTDQARALRMDHPDTPQGRRDRLMMSLLLGLGLRVSELAGLRVGDFDLDAGTVTFYRQKVDKIQTHRLVNGTWEAARQYIAQDAGVDKDAPVLRASHKSGNLSHAGMTRFGISKRVCELGKAVGVWNLSPHDCRHAWATNAARNGTDSFALRDAGGWSSMAMPGRYVDAAAIANQGVKLDGDQGD